jgi:predicted CXXCH cytochrome family protein
VHDDCDYCHNVHGGGGFIPLTDHNRDVDLCLSCHDDGAPPTYNGETVPKGVAVHAGTDHAVADTTSCIDCHDHEGEAAGNLALIPRQLNSRYTGLKTVVFTARTGTNSFADGNTTYDGVCEVCHTQTTYHLSTGAGASHNAGQECVTCHAHDAGFQGAGGCTVCHNTPQDNGDGVPVGGRRAVVGEFARRSHHVLVTPADSIPDGDCTTCHDMAQHQQGSVRVKNADNAGIIYTLTGDPATSSTEAVKLTAFCLACHDADAAGGGVPFSDGQTPPVIDNAFWVASSHEQSAAIVGCYGDGQFGCHATGHGSVKQNLLAPAGTAPTPPANAEEEEGFCLSCHRSGGVATTDLKTAFDQPINWVQLATGLSSNPNLNDRHDVQYAAQTRSGAKIECTSCHDPHRASAAQKYILDPDPSDGHVVGTDWYFAAYQTANDRLSEFCLDCHDGTFSSGVIGHPAPYPITNIRTTWIDDGMGARTASSANLRSGTGWTIGDVLPCRACHATHLQLDRHVTPPSVGTPSLFRVVDMVWNKAGTDSLFFQDSKASDPLIYNYAITNNQDKNDFTSGGYWCNTCHNRYSMTGKENCYDCHRHGDGGRW